MRTRGGPRPRRCTYHARVVRASRRPARLDLHAWPRDCERCCTRTWPPRTLRRARRAPRCRPMDAMDMLLTRASHGKLREPAPDDAVLERVFAAALRAPDHGLLRPWRFQLIRGDARARFGEVLRSTLLARKPNALPEELEKEQRKPLRAPLLIVVSAR